MKLDFRKPLSLLIFLTINSCGVENSEIKSLLVRGDLVRYKYKPYTVSADESSDTYQQYVIQNRLLAGDVTERFLPVELQGLFFLEGASLPDKTLSLKHVAPMDDTGSKLRWTAANKTTFSWLHNDAGHKAFAKAKNHQIHYELEWRDCNDEVMADMIKEFAAMLVLEPPVRCTKADRRFAVITGHIWYENQRVEIPEDVMYFDMYLIPQNFERDYPVWHRRSKICRRNVSAVMQPICSALESEVGAVTIDGYSRHQLTQVLDPNGKRTAAYNQKLVPEIIAESGVKDNVFLLCDPMEQLDETVCLDGAKQFKPVEQRDIDVVTNSKGDLNEAENLAQELGTAQFLVEAGLDLVRVFMSEWDAEEDGAP